MSSSVRAIRRMSLAKLSVLAFVAVALVTTLLLLTVGQGFAMPGSPTDESKVPHYFGPYPNWANSPLTLPDVTVDIQGNGSGAKATATVGANGAITGVTITDPGSGYTNATINFNTTGAGSGASASAVITSSGAATSVAVDPPGAGYVGYLHPVVSFSGGAPDATGTAFGGVFGLSLDNAGTGYHVPTVAFDLPDDPNGTAPTAHVTCAETNCAGTPNPVDGSPGEVTITGIVLDTPGSGYANAPGVAILDGTQFDPIRPGGSGAVVTSSLFVQSVSLDTFGAGYSADPVVTISDSNGGVGSGATASAKAAIGEVTGVTTLVGGSGYVTPGGIKKFQDSLPGLCDPDTARALAPVCRNDGSKEIPLAVADPAWQDADGKTFAGNDTYEIALVQYQMKFSSDLPPTLVRGYVQIQTPGLAARGVGGAGFPLTNTVKDPANPGQYKQVPALINGVQAVGVTNPQYLGPTIVAVKDTATRIVFHNLLPTQGDGDLFLPVDSTLMGSGMGPNSTAAAPTNDGTVMDGVRNPMCTEGFMPGMPQDCFTQNRATLHLHGGITPWISDGTPHQWITPANEQTDYPQGVSVQNVPDMNVCNAKDDGCQTFYYTNEQSARLMFYHDHAWGITRLNVYAGEAAGYLLTDGTEQKLLSGALAGLGYGTPLVIQDKTFVPSPAQMAQQDPTWDYARWGGEGNLWNHHVYMPAQNPSDPSGMSAFGRWMYGPWFWPPASPPNGPIDNPYYDPNCDPNTAAFCEPQLIPGTPNISVGMEQFNDTPVVNGQVYPVTAVDPKAYRFRILNAANDRFWNLQWYVADDAGTPLDPTDDTEVALKPAELAAAQTDPNVFPTPDTTKSPQGPQFIQIGTEGGFLPAPVVVPNQPTTWITDPTRFDVGNVDKHALLLAPAERADVIVDFSAFRGKTLILYNDAPAAFPARVASYDYYTGDPDLSPVGAPSTLPGYGPNTRTIMRVNVADVAPAPAFNMATLNAAFRHHADGSGVFESGSDPTIVGQAAYNSAYGTNFVASGWCNAPGATGTAATRCDGYARIAEGNHPTDLFGFNGLKSAFAPGTGKLQIPFQPKGLHDEMNSTSFDEYGRMQATIGLEAPNANPLLQNIILYPFVNPSTELIDGTNLPQGDINVTPIAKSDDGTQIWKITHNGVDTHPIHWHLWNVQVVNRVTWDNIIIPPDPNELGWKDTVRVSPLEDTIVAVRPIIPTVPFESPNSIRYLNPMEPKDSQVGFNNVDPNGNPTNPITNVLTNFGWEYVYHCHILSHEEMDMMRPVSVALPPNKADGLTFTINAGNNLELTWNDNSINETSFLVQRDDGSGWVDVGVSDSPLDQPNIHGPRTLTDPATYDPALVYGYRVVARNTVGYGAEFPSMTVQSVSATMFTGPVPAAPTNLTAAQGSPQVHLNFTDNATDETGFTVQRADNGGPWATIATLPANTAGDPTVTGPVTYTDTTTVPGTTYDYRVRADKGAAASAWSNTATVFVEPLPAAPTALTATLQAGPQVALAWVDNANNESGFTVQRSTDGGATWATLALLAANTTAYIDTAVAPGNTYDYQVSAFNITGASAWAGPAQVVIPAVPGAPTNLTATLQAGPQVALAWTDNATNETGFTVERAVNGGGFTTLTTVAANTTAYTDTTVTAGNNYDYRVRAEAGTIIRSAWSNTASVAVPTLPAAPSGLTRTITRTGAGPDTVVLRWVDNASNEASFTIQRATNSAFTAGLTTFTVGANVVTYTNTVAHGQTYYYRVQAVNISGASTWSNTVNVTTVPATPTNFRSTGRTTTSITLAWNDVSANETGYRIQRHRTGMTTWTTVVTTAANRTTYTNNRLTRGTSYQYRIRGVNGVGNSPWSPIITVSTAP